MPSGKTHDRVTWICAPVVALLAWLISAKLSTTALATGCFVFAGLMFSGDLDLKSVQYKRWGFLRWIWLPYQRLVPHRSPFSHGPVLGTLTRLLYLSLWVLLLFGLGSRLALWLRQDALLAQSRIATGTLAATLWARPDWLAAILAGLWLGALSHTAADETVSRFKRWRRRKKKPAQAGPGRKSPKRRN